jgi:hypothetical protein
VSEEGLLAFVEGRAETVSRAAVEAHLCDCRSCREVVGALRSTRGSAGSAATTVGDRDGAPQPAEDEVIDEYRIARAIGRGGMGQVYLARDTRLDRDVALKFCSTASASTAKRIEREAIALARLAHPNVVVVFGVGEWRGQFYIAMEYVEGGNAREWLRAGPRTWREIVALYVAAGDGLAAAHARGFVHRDFKPDNVLVGDDGRPRVADFGLVGADPTSSEDGTPQSSLQLAPLTRNDAVVGTVGYMAPEQLEGGAVDARADQYAFCVALWEALFGRKPIPAQPYVASPLPRRILRALRRGLEAEREHRFPTMKELLAELRRDWRTRRVAIAAAAGASVLAVGGYVMFTSSGGGADGPIACTAADPDAGEVYVDASSRGAPANGTAACPYKTITSALATRARVVYVAAGTYDAKLGEKFPLVVRGERRIVGAGVGETRVVGVGKHDATGTGVFADPMTATFVVGDDRASMAIAKLSILGNIDHPTGIGVICDRGNLRTLDVAPPALPAASFVASDVEIAGYDNGVIAGYTLRGTACNARVERAVFHDDFTGAWALGCGGVDDPGQFATALDIEASKFEKMTTLSNDKVHGLGVRGWDCTRWIIVRDSKFVSSDMGIAVVNHEPGATLLTIEHNWFQELRSYGVAVGRAASIERLVGNTFAGISPGLPTAIGTRGVGLILDGGNEEHAYPQVRYARDNAFTGNDVGIEFRGRFPIRGTFDFGRSDDPGKNTIRCNSTLDGTPIVGHDLVVRAQVASDAKLLFAGNVWDHVPPTGDEANGADIDVGSAGSVVRERIDASGATVDPTTCSTRMP